MDNVARLSQEERNQVFLETAAQMGTTPAIVEKDFWVCYVLERIFKSEKLRSILLFKGGTSLSKVYKVIERFSEDIDLILDWNLVSGEDPHLERSKNKEQTTCIQQADQSMCSKVYCKSVVTRTCSAICSALPACDRPERPSQREYFISENMYRYLYTSGSPS